VILSVRAKPRKRRGAVGCGRNFKSGSATAEGGVKDRYNEPERGGGVNRSW
jgi:hypothetical protein